MTSVQCDDKDDPVMVIVVALSPSNHTPNHHPKTKAARVGAEALDIIPCPLPRKPYTLKTRNPTR